MRILSIILLSLLAFACRHDTKPSAPQQPAPGEWFWSYSQGMKAPTKDGDWWTFDWNPSGEADMLLKNIMPNLTTNNVIEATWRCGDCQVRPTEGSIPSAKVSLILIGIDFNSERLFWAGQPISNGGGEIRVPLDPKLWGSIYGKELEPDRFSHLISSVRQVGFCFGSPDDGATCHGARGTGKMSFTYAIK